MKKFLKNNWLIMIILVGSLFYFIKPCVDFIKSQSIFKNNHIQMVEYCNNLDTNDIANENMKEFCNAVLQTDDYQVDFYTMLTSVTFDINKFNGVAFFLLVIPSMVYISKVLKSKYVFNFTSRQSYKAYMKWLLLKAYRYVWFLPLLAVVIITICIAYTGNLNPEFAIANGTSAWNGNIIYYPLLFILLYIVNILLYSFTFINISLIVFRKNHSFVKGIILSIILYIVLELFFEIFVNVMICQWIFKSEIGYLFNIMNIFTFSDVFGTTKLLLFTIVMFSISCITVYLCYKNKESFIIDSEKNN